MDHSSSDIKLKVIDIEKSFPGVKALDKVNFTVKKGTVHVLCGENGAGKSTLMKIINGIYKPDSGKILIDGKEVEIKNPIQARHLGISMIFQELNYIPEQTIAESLCLGTWPVKKLGNIDWRKIKKQTQELLLAEGLNYDPDTKLKDLTISDVQILEIMKAVSYSSEIIIMDEPTSAITLKEVDALFRKINELKSRGVAIIYISHKMEEIFRIADEITVFRDGTVVDSRPVQEYDLKTIISQMVGRKLEDNFPKEQVPVGDVVLDVKGLSGEMFQDVSFYAREGEIVGFAGLMGAGRTEVMRGLFGLDKTRCGEVRIKNKPVKVKKVRDSIEQNMVMLSEDRRRYGIVPIRSVRENVSLANLKRFIFGGRLHAKSENETIQEYCGRMNVKTPTLDTTVDALSGGNQQKVVLAKWMLTNPDILILDEATRGIDVGAKYEIYRLMTELVKQKKALIMVSSELPELIGMCDRIYVMSRGRITGELASREEFSQEHIMTLATAQI